MSEPSARCADHGLATGEDGMCVLCRRHARAVAAAEPAEPEQNTLPWLPIVLASGFGLVFVGGLVGSAFLLAGSDDARADEIVANESASIESSGEPSSGAPAPGAGRSTAADSNRGATGSPVRGNRGSTEGESGKADVPIEIYAASWCPACRAAKRWLDGQGYRYTEYDIDHDAAARQRLRTLNPRGSIPVIVVDSSRTFVGFDPQSLEGAITEAARRR